MLFFFYISLLECLTDVNNLSQRHLLNTMHVISITFQTLLSCIHIKYCLLPITLDCNSSIQMATTTDLSHINHFDRLPDELVEKIFFLMNYSLPLTTNNHVRLGNDSFYFDYSIQKPLLKQTHTALIQASLVCHRFYQIIKSPHFWEQKGRLEHVLPPSLSLPSNFTACEKLFVNNPFHPSFNLLEESNWRKTPYTTSEIQLVPIGCQRLYDEFNRVSPCRVTSYTRAEFVQRDVQLLCKEPDVSYSINLLPTAISVFYTKSLTF
jgi:hypothetical protein